MTNNFNLDTLLNDLESEVGLTKAASEAGSEKPALSAELESALEKKASAQELADIEAQGRAVAKSILGELEKVASELTQGSADDLLNELVGVEKQAEENFEMNENTIDAIAERILEKLAFEGDANTATGVEGAPVPNKIQVDNAANVNFQEQTAQDNPQGTVNQIFDQIVEKARSMGGVPHDQVEAGGMVNAGAEGADPAAQAAADEVEKAAAVSALVEHGLDFETASDLVKEASYEIEAEEDAFVKAAALDELMAEGYDFDTAVDLIKEAGIGAHAAHYYHRARGAAHTVGKAVKKEFGKFGRSAKALATSKHKGVAARNLAKNHVTHGIAGAAGVGAVGGAYAAGRAHEKKAALDELMYEGYDFDTAVEIIKEAGIAAQATHYYNRAKGYAHTAGKAISDEAGRFGRASKALVTSKHKGVAAKALAKNHIAQGIAGTAALGTVGGAYAAGRAHEKKAALEMLMSEGVDFETASELVKEASYELYGE